MEACSHSFKELFQQLGLPADKSSIENFLREHSPLPEDVLLHKAEFWSPAQAAFLKEEIVKDADWAPVIDKFSVALRRPH